MISVKTLYTLLYSTESKFEFSVMNKASVKQFLIYLICELSTLPNGKLVSIISAPDNEESTAEMVDRLILLCKYHLDIVVSTYPENTDEYNLVYKNIRKILYIFGIINDQVEVPRMETIDVDGNLCEFIPESLTTLSMFALLRGEDWLNNRRFGGKRAMISIYHKNEYENKLFIKHIPTHYRMLRNICDEVKQYTKLSHCEVDFPNSMCIPLINSAIEIRRYHTGIDFKLSDKVLRLLDELTLYKKHSRDTKILYVTIWIMNILYYRYGNDEILNTQYISVAHQLARQSVPREYRNTLFGIVVMLAILAVALLSFILSDVLLNYLV